MTTPLPEPALTIAQRGLGAAMYTEEQILNYGAAEFKRGIDAAADACLEFDACNPGYMAAAIRALGATP